MTTYQGGWSSVGFEEDLEVAAQRLVGAFTLSLGMFGLCRAARNRRMESADSFGDVAASIVGVGKSSTSSDVSSRSAIVAAMRGVLDDDKDEPAITHIMD